MGRAFAGPQDVPQSRYDKINANLALVVTQYRLNFCWVKGTTGVGMYTLYLRTPLRVKAQKDTTLVLTEEDL